MEGYFHYRNKKKAEIKKLRAFSDYWCGQAGTSAKGHVTAALTTMPFILANNEEPVRHLLVLQVCFHYLHHSPHPLEIGRQYVLPLCVPLVKLPTPNSKSMCPALLWYWWCLDSENYFFLCQLFLIGSYQ